ncbi:alpha/beta hydrolase [Cryptosporangium japonicum]|uniref:AB hydrolase-1 domain-containing protein n=1 Tax=Cryptosporangium japonicum TaxID=80872 RepID=A0ABN0TXZ4_9ACTN
MTDLGLAPADLIVPAETPLGVRDHGRHPRLDEGGWSGDLLLVPGARGTADEWDAAAALLRGLGYRPVVVEPRGHGRSGAGEWTWPAVLADLETVAGALGLERPAVVGRGLGGVIAALWAAAHPECPLAVSIDGYGNPVRPEQLASLPDADRAAGIAQFSAFLAASLHDVPETLSQALRAVEGLDVLALYRGVRAPTAVLLSEESDLADLLPTELGLVWLAYLDWVGRALTAQPRIEVVRIPGSNDAYLSNPEQLAGTLAGLLPAPASADGRSAP